MREIQSLKRSSLRKLGEISISYGIYRGKKLKELPIDYLHWLIYTNDKCTDWIKEKHSDFYFNAEKYYINYEKSHIEGDYILNFGRFKGKKLSEIPSKYIIWLSNKSSKDSINWVRDKFPDAVINAQEYLKQNNLCFKCGKIVTEDRINTTSKKKLIIKLNRKVN